MYTNTRLALASAIALALTATATQADPGRVPSTRLFPTGNVIFFHPDGAGLNHYNAARLYFRGADGLLNFDNLPFMAAYRGHMRDNLTASSNGGATTHAFGYKVLASGSFGKDGNGTANPPTDRFIDALSGHRGSIMREAAAAGMPVGVINDGQLGEPGSGAFLAEAGHRNQVPEIIRQMIQGRPGFNDPAPWIIMGGGEAFTRPASSVLVHRNHNDVGGVPLNFNRGLRTDGLDLEADWDDNGLNPAPGGTLADKLAALDDYLVIKTRADFTALRAALNANVNYAPRVLGLFAFANMMNDRNEEDLIARGKRRTTADCLSGTTPIRATGPAPDKQSCLILWGDQDPTQPGFNPPTFAEMTDVAIQILDRAARQQPNANARRFMLVAEQESVDNFGNNNNAVGMLHAIRDTDNAIGHALDYVRRNPRTMIVTAADSDAGNMTAFGGEHVPCGQIPVLDNVPVAALNRILNPSANPATGLPTVTNTLDGVEGRATLPSPVPFVSEPDQAGNCSLLGIAWASTGDVYGGIVGRSAGLNAGLLNTVFSGRYDNIDVYRMMYVTLFGRLLNYPTIPAPTRAP